MAQERKFVVKERKLLKLKPEDELALEFHEFVQLRFGKGVVGRVLEASGDLVALVNEEVIIPMNSSLEGLENVGLKRGDIIAIKHFGIKRSKSGRDYSNIRYTVYSQTDVPF